MKRCISIQQKWLPVTCHQNEREPLAT